MTNHQGSIGIWPGTMRGSNAPTAKSHGASTNVWLGPVEPTSTVKVAFVEDVKAPEGVAVTVHVPGGRESETVPRVESVVPLTAAGAPDTSVLVAVTVTPPTGAGVVALSFTVISTAWGLATRLSDVLAGVPLAAVTAALEAEAYPALVAVIVYEPVANPL